MCKYYSALEKYIVILSPPNHILDQEALRVVSSSPDWTPGYFEGKPVAVLFTFPINFALEDPQKWKSRKGKYKR
ncbi:MAG TPA: energy transducer TonB [Bacteroidales bacterium]|nr:energy transducer TonB [Bacteroidales bacterium]